VNSKPSGYRDENARLSLWGQRAKTVLVIIGLISVLRLGLRFGQPQYEVRVSLENSLLTRIRG
jgi:hypothetical protein